MNEKTDWAFHPLSYYDDDSMENNGDTSNTDKTQTLKVQGESDGQKAYVSASNRETADYQLHSLMFYWNDEEGLDGRWQFFCESGRSDSNYR